MKFFSKIFKAKVIASIFIIVWIIILILITINHSLSFVNPDGCLKKTFKSLKDQSKIRSSYSRLLEDNTNEN